MTRISMSLLRKTEPRLAGTNNPPFPAETRSAAESEPTDEVTGGNGEAPRKGLLIVNADDWGQDRITTDRILECVRHGSISSVSAMVFMEDSERSATIARESGINAGLHINFTTAFSSARGGTQLVEHQQKLSRYLRQHRFSPVVFHPGLTRSFEYVVAAQLEEFHRIYDAPPDRVDGHHHMHVCANVLVGRLLPAGTMVRRNFSFRPGEKGWSNRAYRGLVDRMLAKRHRLTDFFFSLPPLEPKSRLQRIFSLARQFVVEVETHPVNPEEYEFLTEGEFFGMAGDIQIARRYMTPSRVVLYAAN